MINLILKIDRAILTKVDKKRLETQARPEGVFEARDIPYIDDGDKYHLLDVYRPLGNEEVLPVIISVHGGSWCYGDKEVYRNFCMDISKRGFAVVNFSYRLAPDVPYYEQIKDIFAVFEWVKNNAQGHKFDLNNIFITGDSAGAHLCGLSYNISMHPKMQNLFGVKPSLNFNAMCLNCGATELKQIANKFGYFAFKPVIGPGFRKSDFYAVANYLDSVPQDSCPVFFISSYLDFMKNMVKKVYEKVTSMGIETKLFFLEKGQHAKNHKPTHVYNIIQPYWEECISANDAMCDFFKEYLSNK